MNKPKRKRSVNHINKNCTISVAKEKVIQQKQIEGLRKGTIHNYKKFFNQLLVQFGDIQINELTEDDAKDFISNLIESGIQNSTINNYLQCAKKSFEVLEVEEITTNIFKNIKRLKVDQKAIEILTLDEIRLLLKSMDLTKYTEWRDHILIHVLLDTMGRIGETMTLKVEDIDFIHSTVTFKNTKGRKARIVPISNKTLKLLGELIEENKDFKTDQIFVTWNGKPLERSAREVSTKLKVYAKRAGIKKNVHFHLFRHTSASFFLKESKNLRMLQQILGHTDITITQRYAHVLDGELNEAVQRHSIINQIAETRKTKRMRRN